MSFGLVIKIFLLIGALFKDAIYLRLVFIVVGLVEIIYLGTKSGKLDSWGIAVAIAWVVVNGYYLVYKVNERTGIIYNAKERKIKANLFTMMDHKKFKLLINSAKWKLADPGEKLLEKGVENEKLMLIVVGAADVFKGKRKIAQLKDGNFIGELSYFTGKSTNADVISNGKTEYLYWEKNVLYGLMKKHKEIKSGIFGVVNQDLIEKLSKI